MSRLCGLIVLTALSGCAASPFLPLADQPRVQVRLTDADGNPPKIAHAYSAGQGIAVGGDGSFDVALPEGGVRVLRVMSPLHSTETIPIADLGQNVTLDVRLGRPRILDDLSHAMVVSGFGAVPFKQNVGGNYEALVPTLMLQYGGVTMLGVGEEPMSVGGANAYVASPEGVYVSFFNPPRGHPRVLLKLDPHELRANHREANVRFDRAEHAKLYEIHRWRKERARELRLAYRQLLQLKPAGPQLEDDLATAREELARTLAARVDGSQRFERTMWLMTALELLSPHQDAGQLREYAHTACATLPADSELWSLFGNARTTLVLEGREPCGSYLPALTRHPDPYVALDVLFATVVARKRAFDAEGAERALHELEKRFPQTFHTHLARRMVGVLRKGAPAPELDVARFGSEVARVRLDALKGRPVLLNFWATECQPCSALLPEVRAVREKFAARGLEVVHVSIDEDKAKVDAFVAQHGAELTGIQTMLDATSRSRVEEAYGLFGVPMLVLVGGDGTVIAGPDDFARRGITVTVEDQLR